MKHLWFVNGGEKEEGRKEGRKGGRELDGDKQGAGHWRWGREPVR